MKFLLIRLIRTYQAVTRSGVPTPFTLGAYSGCRSWPTCSEYAYTAIEHEGVLRGGYRALVRFLRCNPLTSGVPSRP